MVRANYYGPHYDQRGTIDGSSPSAKLGSEMFVDLELGYNVNDNLRFVGRRHQRVRCSSSIKSDRPTPAAARG